MKKVYYLYILNLIAAFLLFQIELIIAKVILPKFGGSYLIWGACVVFFQCILLLGYFYSHLVIQRFGMHKYRYVHVILILVPLFLFPGRQLPVMTTHPQMPIVADIFLQLTLSIGAVFFILSTTTIITQSWLSKSDLPEQRNPYVLYAVSNIGSFLGLLSYPFFFEYLFTIPVQLIIWRVGYLVFLCIYFAAFRAISIREELAQKTFFNVSFLFKQFNYTQSMKEKLYWFLLSAAGCMLFLSVTNIVTYEIAPCPLLWVIPLCIYLISFVLTFRDRPLCPVWIRERFSSVVGLSILLFFLTQVKLFPTLLELIVLFFCLFCMCMFCQHQLYQDRPQTEKDLTAFYLVVSFGGFMGSFVTTWIIPKIFNFPFEYLIGIFLIIFALKIRHKTEKIHWRNLCLCAGVLSIFAIWPMIFTSYNFFGIVLIFAVVAYLFKRFKDNLSAMFLSILLLCVLTPAIINFWSTQGTIFRLRNYYGIYKVYVKGNVLILSNGTTTHGAQFLIGPESKEPSTYFSRISPAGKLMESDLVALHKVGLVGLGAGTLAAYGREGQTMDFYELDPDMLTIAKFFSYLKDSRAKLKYLFGDARIRLHDSNISDYDLLVIDAFSGDAVPVHLLTVEAIKEYKTHIQQSGIILFHVTNRYLDLVPVVLNSVESTGAYAFVDGNQADWNIEKKSLAMASVWVALTWDKGTGEVLSSKLGWQSKQSLPHVKTVRAWTDSYSNVLSVFNPQNLINSFKLFMPFYW